MLCAIAQVLPAQANAPLSLPRALYRSSCHARLRARLAGTAASSRSNSVNDNDALPTLAAAANLYVPSYVQGLALDCTRFHDQRLLFVGLSACLAFAAVLRQSEASVTSGRFGASVETPFPSFWLPWTTMTPKMGGPCCLPPWRLLRALRTPKVKASWQACRRSRTLEPPTQRHTRRGQWTRAAGSRCLFLSP